MAEHVRWQCTTCTFINNEYVDQCKMCISPKSQLKQQWRCSKCTLLNDINNKSCYACAESYINSKDDNKEEKQPPKHSYNDNIEKWFCSKCTFANSMNTNRCLCGQININTAWKCLYCTTINSIDIDKVCIECGNINSDRYWKCSQCKLINDKKEKDCIMRTQHTQHTQHIQRFHNIADFVPFIDDKDKNKTITVILSKDNMIQRKHFNNFKEIVYELNKSSLCINRAFMEKQLDLNNCEFVTIYIDVIQELTAYLRKNNQQILQEIKLAIECQNFQPIYSEQRIVEPIWDHINQCVFGLFESANGFLELRDGFVLILMDIMWKLDRINIDKSKLIIEKLKQNIDAIKTDELKMNDSEFDDKVFKSLNKIRKILPGNTYFVSLLQNIRTTADEINTYTAAIDSKINEHNTIYKQRKQQIEDKRTQIAVKKNILEQEKKRFEEINDGNNIDLAQTLMDRYHETQVEHNKLVNIMNEDIRKRERFSENFEYSIEPLRNEKKEKQKKYNTLIFKLQQIRSLLGIESDDLIKQFLEKMHQMTPLSIRIYSRMIQFKVLISTLSELLKRGMNNDNGNEINDSPLIECYFVQSEIRLNAFIKPLNDMNIYTIEDFKNRYKGKQRLFETELIPHLKKTLKRKIKLGEIRRLKSILRS